MMGSKQQRVAYSISYAPWDLRNMATRLKYRYSNTNKPCYPSTLCTAPVLIYPRKTESLRIHVATTIDATQLKNIEDNAKYNLANCKFSQEMFASSQPHLRENRSTTVSTSSIKVKYWCEKGRFISDTAYG